MAPKSLTHMPVAQLVEHIEALIAKQDIVSKPEAIRISSLHDKDGVVLVFAVELVQEPVSITLDMTTDDVGLQELYSNAWRVACYIGEARGLKVQRFQTHESR